MKALRVIGHVCLFFLSVYSIVFSDSKNFDWFVVVCWGGVFYYWWFEDRDARKAREEKRFQELASRLVDLEYQIRELQRITSKGARSTW
jgi:hypothetical protein